MALAGECLRDMQKAVVFGLPGGADIWDTGRYGLAELCDITTVTNMTMPERAKAGRVLIGSAIHARMSRAIFLSRSKFQQANSSWVDKKRTERPQHTRYLSAYRIGKYPVTNAQYRRFVEDGGYTEKWRTMSDRRRLAVETWRKK